MSAMARLVVSFLLCALAPVVLAEEVYRWVDAEGVVHYTATPPPAGQQAERMTLRASRSAPPPAPAPSAAQPGAADAEPQPERKTPEQLAAEEAERQAQCANARSIVERLESRPAARFKREDGSYQRYSDEERERLIAEARAFQSEHCD